MKCARQTRTILIIVILFKFVTSNIFRFRYIIAALRRLPNPLIRRRRRRHLLGHFSSPYNKNNNDNIMCMYSI